MVAIHTTHHRGKTTTRNKVQVQNSRQETTKPNFDAKRNTKTPALLPPQGNKQYRNTFLQQGNEFTP